MLFSKTVYTLIAIAHFFLAPKIYHQTHFYFLNKTERNKKMIRCYSVVCHQLMIPSYLEHLVVSPLFFFLVSSDRQQTVYSMFELYIFHSERISFRFALQLRIYLIRKNISNKILFIASAALVLYVFERDAFSSRYIR